MIYEIRNYYFEPKHLNAYKAWARNKAMGYLKRKFNECKLTESLT
jgi:hypothetical protein